MFSHVHLVFIFVRICHSNDPLSMQVECWTYQNLLEIIMITLAYPKSYASAHCTRFITLLIGFRIIMLVHTFVHIHQSQLFVSHMHKCAL